MDGIPMPASTALLPTLHSIPVWSVGATAVATRIPLLLDKKIYFYPTMPLASVTKSKCFSFNHINKENDNRSPFSFYS
jgi:hypothetical protein